MYNLYLKNPKNSPWCNFLASQLAKYGLMDAWKNQSVLNPKKFYLEVKERTFIYYKNLWLNEITKFSSLTTYIKFKPYHGLEKYFKVIKDKRHLTALTRLRLHSHTLAIETGRHSNPPIPREQRLCLYCLSNKVEDEAHFLITCPVYEDLRTSLLSFIADLSDEQEKFLFLMNSTAPHILRSVARYTYLAFNKRKQQSLN